MLCVVTWKITVIRRAVVGVNILQLHWGRVCSPFTVPCKAAFFVGFSQRAWEGGNPIRFPSCVCMNWETSLPRIIKLTLLVIEFQLTSAEVCN